MSATAIPTDSSEIEEPNERSPDATEEFPSQDEVFHLLQNERRRNVLRYLQGTEDPVRMRDVAEQVAAWEHGTTVQALSSDQRQRVYIPLYQSHLPKLDEAGVIDYQQSRGIVERKPAADRLDRYLDSTEADEESSDVPAWDGYYLGASGFGAVLLAGATLNVSPISMLSGFALSLVILLTFTLLTVVQVVIE